MILCSLRPPSRVGNPEATLPWGRLLLPRERMQEGCVNVTVWWPLERSTIVCQQLSALFCLWCCLLSFKWWFDASHSLVSLEDCRHYFYANNCVRCSRAFFGHHRSYNWFLQPKLDVNRMLTTQYSWGFIISVTFVLCSLGYLVSSVPASPGAVPVILSKLYWQIGDYTV